MRRKGNAPGWPDFPVCRGDGKQRPAGGSCSVIRHTQRDGRTLMTHELGINHATCHNFGRMTSMRGNLREMVNTAAARLPYVHAHSHHRC